RDAEDALPWDLNGRVAHRWVTTNEGLASTLDLITDGLTLFTGPDEPRWRIPDLDTVAPLHAHTFDELDARALAIPLTGARLLGPDAREIAAWDTYDHFLRTRQTAAWLP